MGGALDVYLSITKFPKFSNPIFSAYPLSQVGPLSLKGSLHSSECFWEGAISFFADKIRRIGQIVMQFDQYAKKSMLK